MIIDNSTLLFIRATNTTNSKNIGIYNDPWGSSTWQWGRWILFVIFVVVIIFLFIATARVNRRRRTLGQQPIRGTAWLTPPTYRQSERQYVGSTQRVVEDFVPEYTERANDNDLGFYDERGEFHKNGKTEYLPPPDLAQDVTDNSATPLERPIRAIVREPSASEAEFDFSRPNYASDANVRSFPGYFENDAGDAAESGSNPPRSSLNEKSTPFVDEKKRLD